VVSAPLRKKNLGDHEQKISTKKSITSDRMKEGGEKNGNQESRKTSGQEGSQACSQEDRC
jgi:hypothetical protein